VDVAARVAGAPISWGVSEMPGWGYQLPADRVLAEMRSLGLAATELGPDGFLPDAPATRSALLDRHGMAVIGGFVPVVLHDPEQDPLILVEQVAGTFHACGARMVVLAADYGRESYDGRAELDDADWQRLLSNLDRVSADLANLGLTAALHPHVGTAVETPDEVQRLLEGGDVPLCLDTGHYVVAGGDPSGLAAAAAERIVHVHLKDADPGLAGKVRNGDLAYTDAVRAGLFVPLGSGAAHIGETVRVLEAAGYQGWYVVEQDVRLDAEPEPGAGPVEAVGRSLDFLRRLPDDEAGSRP
jgi:inosose dehydratase